MKKSAENSSNDKKSNEESKVRFQCSKCNDTFNDAIALIDHVSSAHESKSKSSSVKSKDYLPIVYPCNECKAFFAKEIQLKTHVKEEHAYATVEKCDQCNKSFYKSYLEKHKKLMHEQNEQAKNSNMCLVCEDEFTTLEELAEHLSNSHKNIVLGKRFLTKSNKCDVCGKGFHSKQYLNDHKKRLHTIIDNLEDFKCDVCDSCFLTKTELTLHQKSSHERTFLSKKSSFECKLCDRVFSWLSHLNQHVKSFHEKRKDYKCTSCEKEFANKKYLRNHFAYAHSKQEAFKCHSCDKAFEAERSLQAHIKDIHESETLDQQNTDEPNKKENMTDNVEEMQENKMTIEKQSESNSCKICNKVFSSNGNLKNHVAFVHEKRRNFKCHLCPKMYSVNRDLLRHLAHHENSPKEEINHPFQCQICNKRFNKKYNMKIHVANVHDKSYYGELEESPEDKKHRCYGCLKEFESKELLKEHKQGSHECKSNTCSVCGKIFSQYQSLQFHVESIHLGVRHRCQLCKSEFTFKHYLSYHIRTVHKNDVTFEENKQENHEDRGELEEDVASKDNSDKPIDSKIKNNVTNEHYCYICMKGGFKRKRILRKHKKEIHFGQAISCKECGISFTRYRNLMGHVRVIHFGMKYLCEICEKKFSRTGLRRHKLFAHKTSGYTKSEASEVPTNEELNIIVDNKLETREVSKDVEGIKHQCHLCTFKFSYKATLARHITASHNNKSDTNLEAKKEGHEHEDNIDSSINRDVLEPVDDSNIKNNVNLHEAYNYNCILCSKEISFSNQGEVAVHLTSLHKNIFFIEIPKQIELTNKNIITEAHEIDEEKGIQEKIAPIENHNCFICLKKFNCKNDLKIHRKEEHKGEGVTRCKTCGKEFFNTPALERHVMGVHFGIRHNCHMCDLTFSYRFYLTKHIRTIHSGNNSKLLGHVTNVHEKEESKSMVSQSSEAIESLKYYCYVCMRQFKSIKLARAHKKTAHKGTKMSCKECGKAFARYLGLKVHMKSVHLGIKQQCHLCDSNFTQKVKLVRHIKKSHTDKSIKDNLYEKEAIDNPGQGKTIEDLGHFCYFCMKEFDSLKILNKHKKETHFGETFTCKKCDKSFSRYHILQAHVQSIHFGIRFQCDVCGAKFNDTGNLSHHKSNKHKGKRLGARKVLKERISKETEGILVHCYVCMKGFKSTKILKAHKREIHEGTKMTCNECGKSFSRYFFLKSHIQSIHFGIKHKCHLCKSEFAYKQGLSQHIKTTHNVKIDPKSEEREDLTLKNNDNNLEEVTSKKDNTSNVNELKTLENAIAKCDKCDGIFDNGIVLKEHIKIDHKVETKSLNEHLISIHMGYKRFECSSCPAKFNVESNLKKHWQTFHSENEFEESNSEECFENIDNQLKAKLIDYENRQIDEQTKLNSNVELTTSEIINLKNALDLKEEENLTCQKCEQVFEYPFHLKRHKEIAHGLVEVEGKLICVICNKNFVNSSELESHIQKQLCEISNKIKTEKVKTEAKVKTEMELDPISKTLQTSNNLTIKREKDNIDQDFQDLEPQTCGVCQLSFRSKSMLKLHYAEVHLQIKPHQCDTCDKQFGRYDYLRDHVKFYHEGQRDYRCHLCKKFFVYRGGLKWHLRERHQLWISRNEVLQNESVFR